MSKEKMIKWLDDEIVKTRAYALQVAKNTGGLFKPLNSKTRAANARLTYLYKIRDSI